MNHFSTSDDQFARGLAEIRRIQTEMDASMRMADAKAKLALSQLEVFVNEIRDLFENHRFIIAQALDVQRKVFTSIKPLTPGEHEVQEAIKRLSEECSE